MIADKYDIDDYHNNRNYCLTRAIDPHNILDYATGTRVYKKHGSFHRSNILRDSIFTINRKEVKHDDASYVELVIGNSRQLYWITESYSLDWFKV